MITNLILDSIVEVKLSSGSLQKWSVAEGGEGGDEDITSYFRDEELQRKVNYLRTMCTVL